MNGLPDQLQERILVLRCQTGDEDAFAEIVSVYGPRLRYYLLKLLGNSEAAEDALQDAWLDVYRGLPRLRQPDAFRAWLYRIARDRAFRVLRQAQPRSAVIDDTELAATERDDEAFSAEDAQRIHRALDTLSAQHREVLLLRFIEDLPYEEIAHITDCNLGTAKSRIHYAKRMLRQEIERMNHDE
jgi:RNA polymerase sigma-70 factor, ECF subfamily